MQADPCADEGFEATERIGGLVLVLDPDCGAVADARLRLGRRALRDRMMCEQRTQARGERAEFQHEHVVTMNGTVPSAKYRAVPGPVATRTLLEPGSELVRGKIPSDLDLVIPQQLPKRHFAVAGTCR
ncbi:MAG: hypothetical protein HZB39_00010 [Planctomycetes bacterium]|nr:hypothetical protein [Planctomycetota bacterium]